MSETGDVVKPILLELGLRRDMLVWRQNSGAGLDPHNLRRWIRFTDLPGLPDIMGLLLPSVANLQPPGCPRCLAVVFGIECKTTRGKLRVSQAAVKKRFGELNAIWVKARSYDDVVRGFKSYGIRL